MPRLACLALLLLACGPAVDSNVEAPPRRGPAVGEAKEAQVQEYAQEQVDVAGMVVWTAQTPPEEPSKDMSNSLRQRLYSRS